MLGGVSVLELLEDDIIDVDVPEVEELFVVVVVVDVVVVVVMI